MKNKKNLKGVIIRHVKSHADNRGFFREIFRLSDKYTNEKFKQISHSKIKKGIVKGWHIHKKQYQWNYLLKGSINVYLKDLRKKSKTLNKIVNFKSSDNKPIIYFFPPYVAHAYIATGKENHMIYGTSGEYDPFEEYKLKVKNELR